MSQILKNKNTLRAKWARISSGMKMLLIFGLGLLPLGLFAMLALIQNGRENNEQRVLETQIRIKTTAQRIDWGLWRSSSALRAAHETLIQSPATPCVLLLKELATLQALPGRYALFANENKPECSSPGYTIPPTLLRWQGKLVQFEIDETGEKLRIAVFNGDGKIQGAGEIRRAVLEKLIYLPGTNLAFDLDLSQGKRIMHLRHAYRDGFLIRAIHADTNLARDGLRLSMTLADKPVSMVELIMVILPIVMWAGATIVGWLLVDRLLLIPLAAMEEAVLAYRPGKRLFTMPRQQSLSKEINELGSAFAKVTRIAEQHEADLKGAIERQKQLVREVHHRVKNNLQIIASLLNLHARASSSKEAAAAYASIQRRVDALAVVHQDHSTRLEENRVISLRLLLSDLISNLRATAPSSAANMTIALDLDPFSIDQDAAVPLAFLVTEIVEYVMLRKGQSIAITLKDSSPGKARLTIFSDSLQNQDKKRGARQNKQHTERLDRIIAGLARQLRTTIERDEQEGRFSIVIAVIKGDNKLKAKAK